MFDSWLDWLDETIGGYEVFGEMGENVGLLGSRIKEAATIVTTGITPGNALSMMGVDMSSVRDLKPIVKDVYKKAALFDFINHVICLLIAAGCEYYLDRRKNFSWVKLFLYYGALYGFNTSLIHQQVILISLKHTASAIETFM